MGQVSSTLVVDVIYQIGASEKRMSANCRERTPHGDREQDEGVPLDVLGDHATHGFDVATVVALSYIRDDA